MGTLVLEFGCCLVMRMDVVGSSILPWVAGSLYVLGLVAIPLYSWLPWMALHNQREYTGGNRWVPAVAILWAIAAISFHFLRKVLTTDPGMTPLGYTHTPDDPRKRSCAQCMLPKPPRAKHCSTCGRCVLAMAQQKGVYPVPDLDALSHCLCCWRLCSPRVPLVRPPDLPLHRGSCLAQGHGLPHPSRTDPLCGDPLPPHRDRHP